VCSSLVLYCRLSACLLMHPHSSISKIPAATPGEYWGEAVSTAIFLENITPMKSIKWDNPYNHWFGRHFNKSRLKLFRCLCYVKIPHQLQDRKFADTSKKALFVGYQLGAHNWRVLLPGGKRHINLILSLPLNFKRLKHQFHHPALHPLKRPRPSSNISRTTN
ncbi:uncharacterized protein VP01_8824g1, partial [Puccinia sorghi]